MALDIRRLTHFVAAAEHGNINRAAESQHITQSALTRSIQVLEDELGAKLFERTPRGVTLTAVGRRLFDHARRIINTAAIAKADMAALITGAGGEIRIGVAPQLATPDLMKLLFGLPRTMPMLSVTITEMFYDSLIHLLRLGELDLAIANMPETSDQSDLNVEVLAEIPSRMSIVMRKNHPLASLPKIPPEKLQQANWVAASQHHYLQTLAKYFTDRHMAPPRYRLYANTMNVLLRAILQEDFLALLPEETIAHEFPPDSIVVVPNSAQLTKRRIGLIYTPNAIRSAAFLRLSNSVTEHYKKTLPSTFRPSKH
ncbi:MAG TPA: LysR family transcriptional regulator [Steroidobacteraceae bacterium]